LVVALSYSALQTAFSDSPAFAPKRVEQARGTGVDVEQIDLFRYLDRVAVLGARRGDGRVGRRDEGASEEERRVALHFTERRCDGRQVVDALPLHGGRAAVFDELARKRTIEVREFLACRLQEALHQHEIDRLT
jgi:hypothetical protein